MLYVLSAKGGGGAVWRVRLAVMGVDVGVGGVATESSPGMKEVGEEARMIEAGVVERMAGSCVRAVVIEVAVGRARGTVVGMGHIVRGLGAARSARLSWTGRGRWRNMRGGKRRRRTRLWSGS